MYQPKIRYKQYKNKLTSILRLAEKMYYRTQFEKKRNYIKGTRSLLNQVIHTKNANRNQPVTLKLKLAFVFIYTHWLV